MTTQQAVKIILFVAALSGAITALLQTLNALGSYPAFAWICYLFFTAITLLIIFLAALVRDTKNQQQFNYVIFGSFFLKLLLSLAVIFTYVAFAHPQSAAFITPFFLYYVVFAIPETLCLMQMSKR